MTKIYRIYDEDYENIVGSANLRREAVYQFSVYLEENLDDDIDENGEVDLRQIDDEYKDEIRRLIDTYKDSKKSLDYKSISDRQAIELLKLRYFEVEILEE